jgi:hypothetical protein
MSCSVWHWTQNGECRGIYVLGDWQSHRIIVIIFKNWFCVCLRRFKFWEMLRVSQWKNAGQQLLLFSSHHTPRQSCGRVEWELAYHSMVAPHHVATSTWDYSSHVNTTNQYYTNEQGGGAQWRWERHCRSSSGNVTPTNSPINLTLQDFGSDGHAWWLADAHLPKISVSLNNMNLPLVAVIVRTNSQERAVRMWRHADATIAV